MSASVLSSHIYVRGISAFKEEFSEHGFFQTFNEKFSFVKHLSYVEVETTPLVWV